MSKWVYDIETLSNCFTYSAINIDTNEVVQYVIHNSRNDLSKLLAHLSICEQQIGFNNINFDYPVLHYIITYNEGLAQMTPDEITDCIYKHVQKIISSQNPWDNNIPHWKWNIDQVDLYKILHYDNKAKTTSLKWVEFSIDFDRVQDMPINHSDSINESQIDQILEYNLNDVKATLGLYNIVIGNTEHPLYKGINKIQLRQDLIDEFQGNKSWINYNDVKLGDEINKITYCNLKGIEKQQVKDTKTIRTELSVSDCIEDYINFEIEEFKDFYNKFKQTKFNPKDLPDGEMFIEHKYLKISFGYGGIHSVDSKRNIILTENEQLIDSDCALNWRTLNLVN